MFLAELTCCFCAEIKSSRNWTKLYGDLFWNKWKILEQKCQRGATRGPQDREARLPTRARRAGLWVPWTPSWPNSSAPSSREKKSESSLAFYDTEPPPTPILHRKPWLGVPSWLRREGFIIVVITNPSISTISWCSQSYVSNPLVGILEIDGDGWDFICNHVNLLGQHSGY